MLSSEQIREIRRLLAKGKSYRNIARVSGASRWTIAKIAAGDGTKHETSPLTKELRPPAGPVARCPTCGGRVYTPCLVCGIRRLKATARLTASRTTAKPEGRLEAQRAG